ncbi:MAG: septum formation protein Maf [Caldilineales bacterium]|nr:septum formation protein Maf [Caldilineales bacterium]
MPELILASASPRRRRLLSLLGIAFTVHSADIDESALPAEAPIPHARRLAETKARAIANQRPDAIVLAADTIVVHHDHILGKPQDADNARDMLISLRESPHLVVTAVAVASSRSAKIASAIHLSEVEMRDYTDAEIETYIASGDPLDKAGAYAIQNDEFRPVARFEGCFASIMGLPLGVVAELLQDVGLTSTPDWPHACQAETGRCCRLQ